MSTSVPPSPRSVSSESSSRMRPHSPSGSEDGSEVNSTTTSVSSRPRRTRAMLAQFYGVGKKEEKDNSLDELNIDSGHFDAHKFVTKLIREKHLKYLIQKESKLTTEIKGYDKDLQTLVYDNYNKFISATDTIKKMRDNVVSMEDEMIHLTKTMEEITECSATINKNLSEKREKIDKLSAVNRTLKKMQFLLELPSRLNRCLEMKAYSAAVKYYQSASKILNQYSHLPSFKSIQQETNEVIKQLKKTLKSIIFNHSTSFRDIEANAKLLIELKEPVQELENEFLGHMKRKLEKILTSFEYVASLGIHKNLENLHKSFLPTYVELLQVVTTVFVNNETATSEDPPKQSKKGEMQYNTFVHWSKELFNNYFQISRKLLVENINNIPSSSSPPMNPESDKTTVLSPKSESNVQMDKVFELEHTTADLKSALELFSSDLFTIHGKIQAASFSDKVLNITSDSIKHFIVQNVNDIKSALKKDIDKTTKFQCSKGKENELADVAEGICMKFLNHIDITLKQLKNFIDSKDKFLISRSRIYKTWIKDHISELFSYFTVLMKENCIPHSIFEIYNHDKQQETSPPGTLILCKICNILRKQIHKVHQWLEDRFPIQQQKTSSSSTISSSQNTFDIDQIDALLGDVSKNLIIFYVEIVGKNLSKLIKHEIENQNWMTIETPTNVREMPLSLGESVGRINNEINALFPDSEKKLETSSGTGGSNSSMAMFGGGTGLYKKGNNTLNVFDINQSSLAKNVMRIFNKHLSTFVINAPELNRSSIMSEIMKLVLKTYTECVRGVTLSKNGFQHIQIDVHYLRMSVAHLVHDESLSNSLLQEIISSATERCINPTILEPSAVESICSGVLQNQQTQEELGQDSSFSDDHH